MRSNIIKIKDYFPQQKGERRRRTIKTTKMFKHRNNFPHEGKTFMLKTEQESVRNEERESTFQHKRFMALILI